MARIAASSIGVSVTFEGDEALLLRRLAAEMTTLLDAAIDADPVHKRLFPDAYDDKAEAASYKELVGDELRRGKQEALATLTRYLPEKEDATIELTTIETHDWLRVLTDMRLAIGTRMEVGEDEMSGRVDPEGDDAPAMMVLHWLGWLQEMLLEAVAEAEAEGGQHAHDAT